jgi:hypothetical protein
LIFLVSTGLVVAGAVVVVFTGAAVVVITAVVVGAAEVAGADEVVGAAEVVGVDVLHPLIISEVIITRAIRITRYFFMRPPLKIPDLFDLRTKTAYIILGNHVEIMGNMARKTMFTQSEMTNGITPR